MRDRYAASHGRPESTKTAANILRIACLAVALMLAQVAQSLDARAYVSCTKIDEMQAGTDPAIAALIERHYGTKDILVAALDQRFLLVRLGSADCPKAGCLYRLVQVADGAVQERFAFQSADWITTVSPLAYYVETLKNLYATIQLDTSENTAILIHLPKTGSVVAVSAWSGRRSLPRCGQSEN